MGDGLYVPIWEDKIEEIIKELNEATPNAVEMQLDGNKFREAGNR